MAYVDQCTQQVSSILYEKKKRDVLGLNILFICHQVNSRHFFPVGCFCSLIKSWMCPCLITEWYKQGRSRLLLLPEQLIQPVANPKFLDSKKTAG